MIRALLRWWRCRARMCPGRVVSGYRNGVLMVGFCCNDCGKVSHYAPAHILTPEWLRQHPPEC